VWASGGYRSVDVHDPRSTVFHLTMEYDTVPVCNANEIWVTYINNVLSNKTILFDILDFWCQLVVIRFVKTLSKRRMFVSSMKISACWLLHRWIKFNKICWKKRPAKTRPNLRTSFCRRDFKNTQPHLNTRLSSGTSTGTFAVSAGPYRNYHTEAGTKNEPDTFFVPLQKKGWKINPHVSKIRFREFIFRGVQVHP